MKPWLTGLALAACLIVPDVRSRCRSADGCTPALIAKAVHDLLIPCGDTP